MDPSGHRDGTSIDSDADGLPDNVEAQIQAVRLLLWAERFEDARAMDRALRGNRRGTDLAPGNEDSMNALAELRSERAHSLLAVPGMHCAGCMSKIERGLGAVPGVGGTVATFIAYSTTKKSDPDPDSFGTGRIEGVIAPEAANNAKDSGALLPTLAFGIPGGSEMAVFLGILVLHGMQPGPTMLLNHEREIYGLILALTFSAVFSAIVGLFLVSTIVQYRFGAKERTFEVRTWWFLPAELLVGFLFAFIHRFLESFDGAAKVRADRLQALGAEDQQCNRQDDQKLCRTDAHESLPLREAAGSYAKSMLRNVAAE